MRACSVISTTTRAPSLPAISRRNPARRQRAGRDVDRRGRRAPAGRAGRPAPRARRRARARAAARPRRPRRTSAPGHATAGRESARAPRLRPSSRRACRSAGTPCAATSSSITWRMRSSRRWERSSLRRRACSSPASSSITPPVTSTERLPCPRGGALDRRDDGVAELPLTR